MTHAEVAEAVSRATLAILAERPPLDFHLVQERATAHRFALHLETSLPSWNIDCEYDRYGEVRKELEHLRDCEEQRRTDLFLPDILVHHRGQHGYEHNLLVIEMKKNTAEDICDFAKLRGLTSQHGRFQYQYGLYINISAGNFDCVWFHNGDIVLGVI